MSEEQDPNYEYSNEHGEWCRMGEGPGHNWKPVAVDHFKYEECGTIKWKKNENNEVFKTREAAKEHAKKLSKEQSESIIVSSPIQESQEQSGKEEIVVSLPNPSKKRIKKIVFILDDD